jgi:hypothetical protein
MSEAIKEALQKLDPEDDEVWTQIGLPRVEVVARLSGLLQLTRAELTDAAPDFNRETARSARRSTSGMFSGAAAEIAEPPNFKSEEELPHHITNQIAIIDWIASEARKREQRASSLAFAEPPQPRSTEERMLRAVVRGTIDDVMARAVGYGHSRPKYPVPQKGIPGIIEIARRRG